MCQVSRSRYLRNSYICQYQMVGGKGVEAGFKYRMTTVVNSMCMSQTSYSSINMNEVIIYVSNGPANCTSDRLDEKNRS